MVRKPAVADMFYPGDRNSLTAQLESFLRPVPEPKRVLAAISPHAGYIYSGGVAGAVFSQIRVPQTVVILGPNHRGIGAGVAINASGVWDTPLGSVSINEGLSRSCPGMPGNISILKYRGRPLAIYSPSIKIQTSYD